MSEQIANEIKGLETLIRETLNTQNAELKAQGETSKTTAKTLGELEKKYESLHTEFENEKKASKELEAKFGRIGLAAESERKSIGRQVVESESFKAYQGGSVGRAKIELKGLTIDSSVGSAGTLIRPERLDFVAPQVRPSIRSLFPSGSIMSNAYEYAREKEFFPLATEMRVQAAAAATTLEVVSTANFYVGQLISVNGESKIVAAITDADTLTITVGLAAIAPIGATVGSRVWAGTLEGAKKPQGKWTSELVTGVVKTIPFFVKVAKQTLMDASALESFLNARMYQGLEYNIDEQLVNGSGSGEFLTGVRTIASTYNRAVGGDTRIDTLRRAQTQVRLADFNADGVMVSPADWEIIELAKGTDARYVWTSVNDGGVQRLWRMPVVDTTALAAGEFVVGNFSQGGQVLEREGAMLELFEQDEDNVQRNLVTARVETRLVAAWYRPAAFVKGTFA